MSAATAEVVIDRVDYVDDEAAFQALQDAVDAGGTVVVTGVFSLADAQSLMVGRYGQDVTIKAGRSGGTLVGGTNTIRQAGAVEMTLAGLSIASSRGSYLLVEATNGTTLRGCRLTGLLRQGSFAAGVRVRNLDGAQPATLLVTDNFIDAGNTTWSFTAMNTGIFVSGVKTDLNATIIRNHVEAAQTAGIFVNDSNGAYTIQKNDIVVAGDATKGTFLWAVGIWGRANVRAPLTFVVADNEIRATNAVFAIGYGDFRKDGASPTTVEIHHNWIQMSDGVFSTFVLHGNVDDAVWKHNTVIGATHNVFAMIDDKWDPAEGNLFDQNVINVVLTDAAPHPFMGEIPKSHLYFGVGANNNVAKGFAALERRDDGQGNIIG